MRSTPTRRKSGQDLKRIDFTYWRIVYTSIKPFKRTPVVTCYIKRKTIVLFIMDNEENLGNKLSTEIERLKSQGTQTVPTKEMIDTALRITEGKKSNHQKIADVSWYIRKNFDIVHPRIVLPEPERLALLRKRSAREIFESG